MNAAMIKALALDALYQVLDNKVFRILLVLVIVPVLGTFLFGFREEGIVFLFGVKTWEYGPMLDFMGAVSGTRFAMDDPQTAVINGFSALVVENLAGTIGVMFTIAAASFFVPRMVEKGAADVLFHKPVARGWLYLSRYFAGLVFIGLFGLTLVGGMYLGFLLVSGHNDPGLLWAAVTLTYVFALIHGVSMLIGVVTRSTVAAILLTILFFMGNGCVHQIWIGLETEEAKRRAMELAAEDEQAVVEEEDEDDELGFFEIFRGTLAALHYVGPKTTDAAYLTSRLRAAVEGSDAFHDPETDLTVLELVEGLEEADPAAARPPVEGAAELLGEPAFHAAHAERSFSIWSRPRGTYEREFAGRVREARETSDRAADAFGELLGEDVDARREEVTIGDWSRMEGLTTVFRPRDAERIAWTDGGRSHAAIFLVVGETTYTLVFGAAAGDLTPSLSEVDDAEDEEDGAEEPPPPPGWDAPVLGEVGVLNKTSEAQWYREQLGWDAELKFNLFFSIGSSLAFTLLVLLLGWWQLSRVDF